MTRNTFENTIDPSAKYSHKITNSSSLVAYLAKVVNKVMVKTCTVLSVNMSGLSNTLFSFDTDARSRRTYNK